MIITHQQGILLAIVLSLVDHTRHGYRPRNVVLVPTESGAWQPQALSSAAQALPGLIVYRFTHSLYYANSQLLADEVTGLVKVADPPLRRLCIDASAIDDIDYTAAETLRSLLEFLQSKEIDLVMCHVPSELRRSERQNFADIFSGLTLYDTLDEVKKDYQRLAQAADSVRDA